MTSDEPDRFGFHPALAGREAEMRSLVAAVRRLTELTITTVAPRDATADIAARLHAAADELSSYMPDPPLKRFYTPPPSPEDGDRPPIGAGMPFDIVVGPFNPLALPVTLEFLPDKALGRAVFTRSYEGAPGCVHGAALAGTFDLVLTAANAMVRATGPTVRLNLRFRRPTLIGEEAVFEGWVTEKTERRVHSLGRIVQRGEVTMEAEGEFAILDHKQVERMARSRRSAPGGGPGDHGAAEGAGA